jgi:multidrug resistance efflux pump
MSKLLYLFFALLLISGCGKSEEKKSNLVSSAPSVNSLSVKISQVIGTGKVEPEGKIITLAASTGGVVAEVYKSDGDIVKKEEPILKLDDEIEQIKVLQLKAQLSTQESQLEMDKLAVEEADARLRNKQKLLESSRVLAEKGAETAQYIDDLATEVTELSITAERSIASVKISESRVKELREQLRLLETEASRKILHAPFDGTILEMHVMKGSAVNQFSGYADIAPSGPRIVRAEIDELFASRVENEMEAEIRFIGSDSTIASGKVIFVSPFLKKKSLFSSKSDDQEDRLIREIKISLNDGSNLILNSKVECIIRLNH